MSLRQLLLLTLLSVVTLGANRSSCAETKPVPKKVLFLAGSPSHGYGAHDHLAGSMLLAKSLNSSGLPIEAHVYHYDWPADPKAFEGVDCIVMYGDGGPG